MSSLKRMYAVLIPLLLVLPFSAQADLGDLFGSKETKKGEGGTDTTVTKCSTAIGTAALQEPEYPVYQQLGLASPVPLVKLMMSRSKCFKVVARGRAVRSIKTERAFADDGELQKGSNMGGGQIKAADYIIVPSIVHKDKNSGGSSGMGGLIGRVTGSSILGGVAGAFKTTSREAQVMLEVIDLRTSEQIAVVDGSAKKKDLKIGAGGFLGGLGGAGGGYDDTDIGKVVAVAFVDAYNNLVVELGGVTPGSAASADNAGYSVSANVKMRGGPTVKAPDMGTLYEGTGVVLTGVENGEWREIEAMGKTGWIKSMYLTR
ncbi:MAG: hypothetical protein HOC23_10865 [Halieaceae bacterium]|jgi:curli biogenesis system outer membrane secretion channel CsgG|nr:hypothetical protein [Halieaceae bacterium]